MTSLSKFIHYCRHCGNKFTPRESGYQSFCCSECKVARDRLVRLALQREYLQRKKFLNGLLNDTYAKIFAKNTLNSPFQRKLFSNWLKSKVSTKITEQEIDKLIEELTKD